MRLLPVPAGLCLVLSSLAAGPAAPVGVLPFRSLGLEQGLQSADVQVIALDAQGALWGGGQQGLYRWDGIRMQRFGTDEGLPIGGVHALFLDRKGRLWAGTVRGPVWFDGARFRRPDTDSGLGAAAVFAFAHDATGGLVLGSSEGPYREYQPGRFELQKGWPGGRATSVAVDRAGRIWVGSDHFVAELDPAGSLRIHGPEQGLRVGRVDGIGEDGEGRLWVRSASRLYMRPDPAAPFQDLSARMPGASRRSGSLVVDGEGRVWIPGLDAVLRVAGSRFEVLDVRRMPALRGVQAVLPGPGGDLWVAGHGIHRLKGRGLWEQFGIGQGLSASTVWCTHRDRQGRLWAGTSAGLCEGTAQGWKPVKGLDAMVRVIAEGPDGRLWLGCGPVAHVVAYDPATGRMESHGPDTGLEGIRVLSLLMDRAGVLWAGTLDGGLFRARPGRGPLAWVRERLPASPRLGYVTSLAEDAQGRLWVGGRNGLAIREGEGWRSFTPQEGLPLWEIQALSLLEDGEAWVAFMEEGGLYRVRLEGERVKVVQHLELRTSTGPALVYDLHQAGGRLWVATSRGLWAVSPKEAPRYFGVEDGLADPDLSIHGLRSDRDGRLWVGSTEGISVLETGRLAPEAVPGAPEVLQALLDGRALAEGRGSVLQVRVLVPEGGWIPETRWVGGGDAWRPLVGGEGVFPGLGPGLHRLELRHRRTGGITGPVATLPFHVRRTWGFWAAWGVGALGLVAVALGLRRREQRQVLLRRELESLVRAQAVSLREAEAHVAALDFRDPLTGLKNRRFFESLMPAEAARSLRRSRRGEGAVDLLFLVVEVDHLARWERDQGVAFAEGLVEQGAQVLKDLLRGGDRLFRLGPSRFLVLVLGGRREDAGQMAERIRRTFCRADLGAEGWRRGATCSLGHAAYPLPVEPLEALGWEVAVAMAEAALEMALLKGGDHGVGVEIPGSLQAEACVPMGPGTLEALAGSGQVKLRVHPERGGDALS